MSDASSRDAGTRGGRVLAGVAIALGLVLFLGGFVAGALLYQPYAVPTDSMAPSVSAGDRVLAERIDGDEVRRGDVVVFTDEVWGDAPMIKRVVGVGGDRVACCTADGLLTVNDEPIQEPYLDEDSRREPQAFSASVPDGELFLIGDHRHDSLDSRSMLTDSHPGTVPREAVSARVDATVWPIGRVGLLPSADGFAGQPGGVSERGPLVLLLLAVGSGVLLIVAGALHGPLVRRRASRRASRRVNVVGDAQ
ncbi:signal peptidase I [Streptomyces sp. 4N509B]|uniref:signal peptidase I n=1 Tax=Streptomyces sp. 4N509B TaxID=3457413 RepID=UPI003FD5B8BC